MEKQEKVRRGERNRSQLIISTLKRSNVRTRRDECGTRGENTERTEGDTNSIYVTSQVSLEKHSMAALQ